MPVCKFCQKPFAWGMSDGKWLPLLPVGEEGDFDRTYQDENGLLRVEHRVICQNQGGPSVRVVKLAKSVAAKEILPAAANETVGQTIDRIRARKKRKKES
jgi:hypothetical protein